MFCILEIMPYGSRLVNSALVWAPVKARVGAKGGTQERDIKCHRWETIRLELASALEYSHLPSVSGRYLITTRQINLLIGYD